MISFKNKNVLIVGNNLGFEKEISLKLSNLGATIILVSQNKELANETFNSIRGSSHKYFNFSNGQDIEKFVENIIHNEEFIDIYIHCADETNEHLSSIKSSKLQSIFDKNIALYLNFIKNISSKKQSNNYLSILYLSLTSNEISASNMSKFLSLELFEKNIRVNSLLIDTICKYDFSEEKNNLMERVTSMLSYLISENANFIIGENYKIN